MNKDIFGNAHNQVNEATYNLSNAVAGHDFSIIKEAISVLMNDNMNNLLTDIPSMEEIHEVVFNMNKDSSPGPNGFGGIFFQTYRSIIKENVCNAVLQFFSWEWTLPNFNVCSIIILPKV